MTHTLGSLKRNTHYEVQIRAQVQFSACSVSMSGAFSDLMTFRTSNTCAYVACFTLLHGPSCKILFYSLKLDM